MIRSSRLQSDWKELYWVTDGSGRQYARTNHGSELRGSVETRPQLFLELLPEAHVLECMNGRARPELGSPSFSAGLRNLLRRPPHWTRASRICVVELG